MRKIANLGIAILLFIMAEGAFAYSQSSKVALLEAFKIMMENGATGSGPMGSNLFRFSFQDFVGDLNTYDKDRGAECSFTSLDNGNSKRFEIKGDSCKNLVDKLRAAGFGGSNQGSVTVTYIGCMISQGQEAVDLLSCEATVPLFSRSRP